MQYRTLFSYAGWAIAAILVALILPRAYNRLVVKFPAGERAYFQRVLELKKSELAATRWEDTRSLYILAGDSQIELGNWYDLFAGVYAVRNCGLSRATIEDVTTLVKAVPQQETQMVILMCGINNINRNDSVEACVASYAELLTATRTFLKPQKIAVLSIMPLRQYSVDQNSQRVNARVRALNELLQKLCLQQNAHFINVTDAVADAGGGLADGLTFDGLHLNQEGYKKIAAVIRKSLTK